MARKLPASLAERIKFPEKRGQCWRWIGATKDTGMKVDHGYTYYEGRRITARRAFPSKQCLLRRTRCPPGETGGYPMGYRDWSERHGNPFPWALITIYAIPVIVVFAVIVGASSC